MGGSNGQQPDPIALLLDHFVHAMPVEVDRHYAEDLLRQVVERERVRIIQEIANDYGGFNDGCGCCSSTELEEVLEKDYLTAEAQQEEVHKIGECGAVSWVTPKGSKCAECGKVTPDGEGSDHE